MRKAAEARSYAAVVRDALLEAELLHARSIIEFLLQNPRRPGRADLLRTGFLPQDTSGWTPEPAKSVDSRRRQTSSRRTCAGQGAARQPAQPPIMRHSARRPR